MGACYHCRSRKLEFAVLVSGSFHQSQYIVRLGKTIGFVRSIYSAPLPSYARVSASMSNFFILRNA